MIFLLAHVHRPINLSHNHHLVSIHYKMARKGLGGAAVDMLSSLPYNSITTVGIDTREGLLHDRVEIQQMQSLDTILASPAFSKLTKIVIRLEYEHTMKHPFGDSCTIIYHAFQSVHRRGIVAVEQLPYERREIIRDLADDCSGTGYKPIVGPMEIQD
jgi:hypothetical protein